MCYSAFIGQRHTLYPLNYQLRNEKFQHTRLVWTSRGVPTALLFDLQTLNEMNQTILVPDVPGCPRLLSRDSIVLWSWQKAVWRSFNTPELHTWWSSGRFGRVDPSVVALAGGQQLQGHSGFRSVLLPRFTGHFFYPGQLTKKVCVSTLIDVSWVIFITAEPTDQYLSSILLESCWRISAERLWYSNWAWTNAASWLTCSICNTHTHICCFHYHPCSVSMLGLSLARHSTAQDGTLLKTGTMATEEACEHQHNEYLIKCVSFASTFFHDVHVCCYFMKMLIHYGLEMYVCKVSHTASSILFCFRFHWCCN